MLFYIPRNNSFVSSTKVVAPALSSTLPIRWHSFSRCNYLKFSDCRARRQITMQKTKSHDSQVDDKTRRTSRAIDFRTFVRNISRNLFSCLFFSFLFFAMLLATSLPRARHSFVTIIIILNRVRMQKLLNYAITRRDQKSIIIFRSRIHFVLCYNIYI